MEKGINNENIGAALGEHEVSSRGDNGMMAENILEDENFAEVIDDTIITRARSLGFEPEGSGDTPQTQH